MARKLFLIFCALGGFIVASVISVVIQSLIPNVNADKPGDMAPDPIRQVTTKKYKQSKSNTSQPKEDQSTQQSPQAAEQQPEAQQTPVEQPAPTPAPMASQPAPAPSRGPGNFDAAPVPMAPVPMAPPPPYYSGPTGPGNM